MSRRTQSRLFLIDGYALIYRAFFAMVNRPLRTSRGENTSAVWGVANFLQRLMERHAPTHMAWVHDAGTSFRADVFPDYKATREKLDEQMQEDFDQSVERTTQLLGSYRIPLVEVAGYEADDVIGTLAHKAAGRGLQTIIVSGDKDFYQLISEDVFVLNPGRGGPAPVEEVLVDVHVTFVAHCEREVGPGVGGGGFDGPIGGDRGPLRGQPPGVTLERVARGLAVEAGELRALEIAGHTRRRGGRHAEEIIEPAAGAGMLTLEVLNGQPRGVGRGLEAQHGNPARLSRLVAGGRLILKDVAIRNPEGFVLENLASAERIE